MLLVYCVFLGALKSILELRFLGGFKLTGKTHVTLGVAAGLTLSVGYSVESQAILVLAAAIGALIPDLDHPRSKINQRVLLYKNKLFKLITYSLMGAGLIYIDSKFYGSGSKILRLLGIALVLVGLSRHRGFTHSLLGLVLFSGIVYIGTIKYNLYTAFTGFVIGYVSHLVLDLVTVQGIELLYPYKKNFKIPLGIKTNGVVENLILSISSLYSAFILLQRI